MSEIVDLRESQQAFYNLKAGFGGRFFGNFSTTIGRQGIPIASRPFNPAIDKVEDIQDTTGEIPGWPSVEVMREFGALGLNLMLLEGGTEYSQEYIELQRAKEIAQTVLASALIRAHKSSINREAVSSDDPQLIELIDKGPSTTIKTSTLEDMLEAIALSNKKYDSTIVISDFFGFDLASLDLVTSLSRAVAIKLNTPLERQLQPGWGTISLGGDRKVNTARRKELKRTNDLLEQKHQGVIKKLREKGFIVVESQIVGSSDTGYLDIPRLDFQIAQAIRSIR